MSTAACMSSAGFEIDPDAFELRHGGRRVAIEPRVLELLIYLWRHAGRLLSREELLATVWGGREVSDWAVARAVRHARMLVCTGAAGDAGPRIETVRGRGYRWTAPVHAVPGVRGFDAADADPFVGRGALLGSFDELQHGTRDGSIRHAALILRGPPGIGKTRALEELAARVRARRGRAWVARCPEGVVGGAFHPWTHWLREARIERHTHALPDDARRALAEAMPELRDRLAPPPGAFRLEGLAEAAALYRLRAHMGATLRHLAGGFACLCIDDLDRADIASLRLLRAVMEESEGGLLLVASWRDPLVGVAAEIRAELDGIERLPDARTLHLPGLTLDEVSSLATRAWGALRARPAAPSLLERTGGNPLFLRQVLAAGLQDGMPASLRVAVREHLRGLPPSTAELMGLAALQGRLVDVPVLARQARLDVEQVEALLRPALHRRLLRAEGNGLQLRFEHSIVAEILLADMDASLRRRRHREAADALEQQGAAWNLVAQHRCAGAGEDIGSRLDAARACAMAADEACLRFAHAEAIQHARVGLEHLLTGRGQGPDPLRLRLLLTLGQAQIGANFVPAGRETLRRAMALAQSDREAAAVARAALLYAGREETPYLDEDRVQRLELALAGLPRRDSQLRAQVAARLCEALAFHHDTRRRERLGRRAVDMAIRLGDPRTLCLAWRGLHLGASFGPDVGARMGVARRELRAALDVGDPILVRDARSDLIGDLLELGRRRALDVELSRFRRLAEETPEPLVRWFDAHYRALIHLMDGQDTLAWHAMEQGYALGRSTGYELAEQWFEMQAYQRCRDLGRPEHFDADLFRLADRHPETPWGLAAALRACELGDAGPARSVLATALRGRTLQIPHNFLWRFIACLLGELACAAGHRAAAQRLYAELRPHAGLQRSIYGLVHAGSVDQILGQLASLQGEWILAHRHFTRALRQAASLRAPARQVDALRARATVQRARSDPRAAERDQKAASAIQARLVATRTPAESGGSAP